MDKNMDDMKKKKPQLIAEVRDLRSQLAAIGEKSGEAAPEEPMLEAIFNHAQHFLAILNLDGTLVRTNGLGEKISGVNFDDFVGHPFWQTIWWTISLETQEQIRRSIGEAARGRTLSLEVDILGARNRMIPVSFTLIPLRNQQQQVTYLLAQAHPLEPPNELINLSSEQYLLQSILSTAFANTPLAMMLWRVVDSQIQIIDWNKAAYQVFGWSKYEVFGKNFFDFLPAEEDIPSVKETVDLLIADKYPRNMQNRCNTKNERKILVNWFNTPIVDSKKNIFMVVSLGEDITVRELAERQLRESENKYRMLFEFANDAILLLEEGRIVNCNEKALQMYRCRREDLLNRTPDELSPLQQPDGRRSAEKAKEKIQAAVAGRPQFFIWKHQKQDGVTFDAEVSLTTFMLDNRRMLLAIVREVLDT